MKDNTPIRAGDRFVKVGIPTTVWIVQRLLSFDGLQPHARLAEEDRPGRTITLSESALLDDSLHRRQPA